MNLERYHRIAQKERTFIGNIKSRMARVRALRAIGFEKFLDQKGVWVEESPELVELVEQCRDEKIAAALGRHPGQQSNIRFLGSLLKMIGLKLKGQKVKSEDGDYRVYRLDQDVLSDPDRTNALQCLDRRWENYLAKEVEILNWESVLTPQTESQQVADTDNSASQQAETIDSILCQQEGGHSQQGELAQPQSGQGFDPVPRTPTEYIYTLKASWNQSDQVESQRDSETLGGGANKEDEYNCSPTEQLAISLSSCDSPEAFADAIEGHHQETIEDAIALQDTQPHRNQLRAWHEALETAEAEAATRPSIGAYQPGEEVWAFFPQSESGWTRGIVEWVRDGVIRVKSGVLGRLIEQADLIAPGNWELSI
jgi:hypothetical protein